ncbi:PAS domain-containing protein [Pedobacter sp. ASV1-7]|uniref:PAS domain-containing sensor histidine kinase n=1 Tax=Pedobacter sp. ASV1-7 TaxID=3145237 RepID=UPI0032E8D014
MALLKKKSPLNENDRLEEMTQLLNQTNQELYAYKYALDESSIIAITDQRGIIRHVNDNFCEISKYRREELIGKDHRIINSGYHDKEFIKNLWHTIANGNIWKGELKNKAKDNSYYWVDTTIVPFLNQEGKPYQYIAIRSDITEKKQAELEIRRQTEQIENLLECITDGFIGLDKNLHYTYANKQVGKILGLNEETLIGKNIWEVFPEAVGSSTYHAIQKALTEKIYICHEDYYQPLNLWQENRIYPIGDGLSIFIRDISKQKREEQHLKLLESVITHTNDAVLITQAEPLNEPGPAIIYVNEAFTKMTGYTSEEIIGKTPRILQGPKSDKNELKKLSESLRTWTPCEVTLVNYKKGGEEFWINLTVTPVADENGCYTHWISVQRDITEKKEMETLLHKATDLAGIGSWEIDYVTGTIYWSDLTKEIHEVDLNYKPDLISGINFYNGIEHQAIIKRHIEQAINNDISFDTETQIVTHKDQIKWVRVIGEPEFVNGTCVKLRGSFQDITERKISEIKLKELNQNLQNYSRELSISNAELEQFAYVASHDLQEPLRMVTSFLTQIEKKYAPVIDDKGRQYIHFAVDGAKRMRQIILDLLEFSRVGKKEDNLEEVNLNILITEITSLFRQQIKDTNAKIVTDVLPTITTYKPPIRQVFQNLIGNSLKYQKPGVNPVISISCGELGTYWLFSITDNGIGIDTQFFDKIFVIFQRLHNKDEYSGTGMGLAITKKIVENLGGKIWVESEENKGTTFHFSILK